jgi:succinate dehydrogenase / fumarate reductase membrane anchor subunit
MQNLSTSKNYENALLWFIKLLAGGIILFFLLVHFIVNHLVAPGGLLTFKDVVHYYQNPLVVVMEGLFLGTVLIHTLLGLRSILLDLNPSKKIIWVTDRGLVLFGSAAFIYGVWLLIKVSSMG